MRTILVTVARWLNALASLTVSRQHHCRTLFFLLLSCSLPQLSSAQTLIVHPSVQLPALDRNTARLLFTMRIQQWPQQQLPVRVFVLPDDHPVHQAFAKIILDLFPYQLRRVWDRQLFSGTGQTPTVVNTEQEMAAHVANTPGAIGYVNRVPPHNHIHVLPLE